MNAELLADAVERLRDSDEPCVREVVRDLIARPAVSRELTRRAAWAEARATFYKLLAAGVTTRAAAEQTEHRLSALGFTLDAEYIRQTLLRERREALVRELPHCAHTDSGSTL